MCLCSMIVAQTFADWSAGLNSFHEPIAGFAAQGPSGLDCTTARSWHDKFGGRSECIKVTGWLNGVIQSSGSGCLC